MLAFVPARRARLRHRVVIFLGIFDQSLQADVSAYLITGLVEGKNGKQTRDPSVAVAERMNAQEVEHQAGRRHQGWDVLLIQRVSVHESHLFDRISDLRNSQRSKSDPRRLARPKLDAVVVDCFPLSGVARAFLDGVVQAFQRLRVDR